MKFVEFQTGGHFICLAIQIKIIIGTVYGFFRCRGTTSRNKYFINKAHNTTIEKVVEEQAVS
ncbi:MAG: hypothetical protein ACERLG_04245 [Sedimentibacter sp.]